MHAASSSQSKLEAILVLSEEYQNINRDTLNLYVTEALRLSENVSDENSKGLTMLAMANVNFRYGWIDSAIAWCNEAIRLNKISDTKSRPVYFKACRQKALYLGGNDNFPEALELLHQLVAEAAQYRDTLTMAANLNTIGSVTLVSASPKSAMQFMREANALINNERKYYGVKAAIYVNMADAFFRNNEIDSALYYNTKGTTLFEQEQNLYGQAMALQRLANVYRYINEVKKAEEALLKMVNVRTSTGDSDIFFDDKMSLVNFYRETNQLSKAISYCQNILIKGDVYADQADGKIFMNRLSQRLPFLEILATCYRQAGNLEAYAATLEELVAGKDSLNLWKKEEAIAAIQIKYDVEKKDNTIIRQELDLSRKNNQLIIAVSVAILLVAGGCLYYYVYRKQQQSRAEKAIREAEEKERERIAADLHDNLGAFAAAISSNLDVLKNNIEIGDSTALHELQDNSLSMVGQLNDTIWAMDKDSSLLTAISDRVKQYTNRLQKSYPHISIEVVEEITIDTVFSPVITFNLFRIIQEGINNALRHSEASKIIIKFSGAEHWTISIIDNGKGMPVEQRKGNGLKNQFNRANKSNLRLSWINDNPTGTQLIIQAV